MFFIYDSVEKKTIGNGFNFRQNAKQFCQYLNITKVDIDEIDKPEDKRRFIIKEV